MQYTQKQALLAVLALTALSCVSSTRHLFRDTQESVVSQSENVCGGTCHGSASEFQDFRRRQAARLKSRLEHNGIAAPSEASLASALETRAKLLTRSVTVQVRDASGTGGSHEWTLNMSAYPALVHFVTTWNGSTFRVDEDAIAILLTNNAFPGSKAAVNPIVATLMQDREVTRANVQIARAGFKYDAKDAQVLADAISDESVSVVQLVSDRKEAVVRYDVDGTKHSLSLLASGISNFEKSPENREHNVLKALTDHVNNIVVQPNETFSFNDTLGGPVTLSRGWVEALGLFGGGTAMTPGGGICQAATTVYRAALMAGFPILRRKSHSVYVGYYEKYGVGIDATIFPGVQDLVFTNDTKGPIVIQAYNDGFDAYVNIYGIPDNRTVTLEGPYFASTRPRPKELRPLDIDQIGWIQRVTKEDGSVHTVPFVSTYTHPIARSVSRTHAVETISEYVVEAEHSLSLNATPTL